MMEETKSGNFGEYEMRRLVNGNPADLLSRTKTMEAVHIVVEPGRTLGEAQKHEGEEFKYVLEGTLEFKVGNVRKIIGAGGWLHHDSGTPHTVTNNTSKKASYISVSVPPGCMAVQKE